MVVAAGGGRRRRRRGSALREVLVLVPVPLLVEIWGGAELHVRLDWAGVLQA